MKIVRISIIDTFEHVEPVPTIEPDTEETPADPGDAAPASDAVAQVESSAQASGSADPDPAMDFAIDDRRVLYKVTIKGFTDPDRYCILLQDSAGTIRDLSLLFDITAEQIAQIQDLTATIDFVGARLPQGSCRCVRLSDLQARATPSLAS